jgi:tetratricopeptide (TPR) repeat protein
MSSHPADPLHPLAMHRQPGDLTLTIVRYREALALKPDWPEAHNDLGNALTEAGELHEAIACYGRALSLKPDWPEACYNLANVLRRTGRLDEAISRYRQALLSRSDDAEIHNNLGVALSQKAQFTEAVACYQRALELKPDWPQAQCNLGNALMDQQRWDEAEPCYRRALASDPAHYPALSNLGSVLLQKGQVQEAIDCYRRALAFNPADHEVHNNLANAYAELGEHEQSVACYRQALALCPDLLPIHANLAHALLLRGDLPEGWKQQEWRWRIADPLTGRPPPDIWDGQDLDGRTIVVHAEQGFGDTIHFIRYVPLLAARGGRVIIECQPELDRLLQTVAGAQQVVVRGQPLPTTDCHALLLSLPANFATTLQSIPAHVPYLHAPSDSSQRWRARLAMDSSRLKIGLAWAGNPRQKNDHNRSMPLSSLAPLAQVPGASFYSLQKGEAANQTKHAPAGLHLIDCDKELTDFAETAALIEQLDLVISVDTSVAHLAGAMAKPTWTMLTFSADWRWLLERQDSPWYPTMRLFRQKTRGDWAGVVERVLAALQQLLRTRA